MSNLRRTVRLRERRTALSPAAAVAIAAVLAACSGRDAGDSSTVTDSAGVVIVSNSAPLWNGSGGWRIGDAALLDLGGDESGPDGIFEHVAGLVLRSDGGIVVGDEGQASIRAFDSSGVLLWRSGRSGGGPGEFRLLASIGPAVGDSIWAFDFGNRRITVLDGSGVHAWTFDLGSAVSAPSATGWLSNGAFVVREMWGTSRDDGPGTTGMRRDPAAILALDPPAPGEFDTTAVEVDTIAVYSGREVYITVENGRGVMSTPLFARNTTAAVGSDVIAIGDQARFVVDLYEPKGTLQRSIRLAGLDLTMSDEVVSRVTEQLLERLPRTERAARRALLESLPGPPSRPAFGRILIAASGELWVSEHAPSSLDPASWYVFDRDGKWLGNVAMPSRFRLEAISLDRVAGVWRDAYDVEHVRVYALLRDAG